MNSIRQACESKQTQSSI